MTTENRLRLGLIGDNIAESRAPTLHPLAGAAIGLDVTYERLVPATMGMDFDSLVGWCRDEGFRGLNITYPYKQRMMRHLTDLAPRLENIGAANTVLFEAGKVRGFNTDHTGFVSAFRATFPDMSPGRVAQLGAGGVGRAVAFGLADLGADEIRLIETDAERAAALAEELVSVGAKGVTIHADASACEGATGVVNCTPVGMVGYPGTPVPAELLQGTKWAFEAIYTPVDTTFKNDAEAAGARVLSGLELFFHQGIQAFELFSGREFPDTPDFRQRVLEAS